MHKFILKIFRLINNSLEFSKIVSVFFIAILTLYWIQSLANMSWNWFKIFVPILDGLLVVANSFWSFSFNFGHSVFEMKFVNATIILLLIFFGCHILRNINNTIKELYLVSHANYKLSKENKMNKNLQKKVEQHELKIDSFDVAIQTRLKNQPIYQESNINIDEQNKLMNNFITDNLKTTPTPFEEGFIYHFRNIEKMDEVLSVLFRVLKSTAPIEYSICIQIDNNLAQLKKLMNLQYFGKIIIARNTAHRYKYNKRCIYNISEVGVYQNDNGTTIQVEEFKNIE